MDEGMLWQRSTHQMASIEVNKAALGGILAPLLSYKFLLPMPHLRAGFAYAGMRLRLRRFARDLLQGHKPLKVAAIGGRWVPPAGCASTRDLPYLMPLARRAGLAAHF